MLELVAGIAVAVAALALVLEPLIRNHPQVVPEHDDLDDLTPLEESESPKVQALLALKEIEFDRATGKLSDDDYERLKLRYAKQALVAIGAEELQTAAAVAATAGDDPAEAMIRAARQRARVCPVCGPRPEADAAFCSECGRPLAAL